MLKTTNKTLNILISALCILLGSLFFTACGKAPGKINFIVLCSIRKEGDKYIFPIKEILMNNSGLKINIGLGKDMGGGGLKYHGQSDRIFPDLIIVCYHVSKKLGIDQLQFQMVESMSVIDGKIPSLNNQKLSQYKDSLH
jgi:hypothetical protein